MESTTSNIHDKLSNREHEVLHLICEGCSREKIADKMGISKLTYDSYRKSIRGKLGIKNQFDWGKVMYEYHHST